MFTRSTVAGFAGMMLLAAASTPAAAQCGPGCDGPTNWSGFWLGAGIGVNADMIGHKYIDYGNVSGNAQITGEDDNRGAAGFIGTVGIGYDWHIRDRWVLGAYADFDFGNVEQKENDTSTTWNSGWKIRHNTTWGVGGRIGLVTTNTSMFYGLIGYSRADLDATVYAENAGGSVTDTKSLTYHGLSLGAGLEHDLGNGFSLKGEYRYTNYGKESFTTTELDGDNEFDEFDLDTHAVKLSLVYKFGRGDRVEEVSYKDVAPAPTYK